ncbi:hypothetical protein [Halapricum desulfuricans]|uniref:Putative membrane protein n=1 Tax=Halapricum desulfuricans TaxID=2841257 RepID=A0A897N050_9EURY|nr:hypothetical protein [Halapricum desulfuricans]QSG06067.1 putative membrane protein [Halapricum desulfuricans]
MTTTRSEMRRRVAESDLPRRAGRLVFGDRRGLALFLGSLCYIALLTRVGVFITDTYTTANAFVALTEGRLAVTEVVYGPSLDTPGMSVVDGTHYGRNYGQLVLSLPMYWLLRGLDLVADLRIALAGAWSLVVLALGLVLGRIYERRQAFAIGASALALVLFVANVTVATPIPDRLVPLLAMQLTGVLAGAMTAVVAYRLVGWLASPHAGVLAGVLVVAATPVGFWSPIPKRHVFSTLLILLALFAFARSRDPETPRRALVHGGAYAATGVLAWIHAPEALVVFVALVLTDLVTSPPSRYRALPAVIGAFLLSLFPFFVTNLLIAGHPFVPPRLLSVFDVTGPDGSAIVDPSGGTDAPSGGTDDPSGGGGSGSDSSGTDGTEPSGRGPLFGLIGALGGLYDAIATATGTFVSLLVGGVETARTRTDQLVQTFVRSGYVFNRAAASDEAINLSVLESAPVLGALVSVPLAVLDRRFNLSVHRLRQPGPATLLALTLTAVVFTLVYVDRLPLHAQLTVRYLLPLYALGVIALAWVTPVRRAFETYTATFWWVTAGSVLLGGQLLLAVVVGSDLALGEAFQLHALLGLGLAAVLAASTATAAISERFDRAVAVSLALTTAASVVFSLFAVTAYGGALGKYNTGGSQLLPIVRVLADLISIV